ncbi:MAG: tetratricopeptide repeat protein [Chloroflexi bacterium]|nr:tetratricopeptide repeat protein [Chloroflexota bacterium]
MPNATALKDRYGLAMTTSSTNAAEHYVEGLDLLLEQGFGPEAEFQMAVEADDGFALAHAGLSIMQMFRGDIKEARATASHAGTLASYATRREQQHVEAVRLFVNGQGPKSLALARQHLDEFPRDALMLRVANRLYLLGCSGAGVANFPEEFFAMLRSVEPSYGEDWAFQGMYAFAHHEMGYLSESLKLAESSLAQRPTSGHASHSVAHVYFETGDPVAGGDFLGDWLTTYDRRSPFHVHLSWHQALFELSQGRYDRAVDLYETDIRPSVKERRAASLQDSTSLMWRLRMYGGENPPYPIEEICDQAAVAADTPGPAFRDAHAALAFAASGDGVLLGKLSARLLQAAEAGDALAKEITLPLVMGIDAFAAEAYDDAVTYLEPVFPKLARIGGSHAQREVFEDTLLEAYLRAGRYDKAEDMLAERLRRRSSVRDSYWLGRAQANTGQADAAGKNLSHAKTQWRDADPNSREMAALESLAGA